MNDFVLVFAVVFMYGIIGFLLLVISAVLVKIFWPEENISKITHIPLHIRKDYIDYNERKS